MNRHITYVALVATGLGLLAGGIGLYRHHRRWLQTHDWETAAFIMLIGIGVFVLVMTLRLWELQTQPPAVMLRDFGWWLGVTIGVATATILTISLINYGITAIIWLLALPIRLGYPYLFLPWLFLLVALSMTLIDLTQRTYARTPSNLGFGCTFYLWRMGGMLTIQLATLGVTLTLLAGSVLQVLSIGDLVGRRAGYFARRQPLLCDWGNLESPACIPLLVSFHLGHLLVSALALRYGAAIFDFAVAVYVAGLTWLAGQLGKQKV